jgi:hypothetical protein
MTFCVACKGSAAKATKSQCSQEAEPRGQHHVEPRMHRANPLVAIFH